MIHCSLQTKTNKKAVLWQGNRTYDAVVKFNTCRNVQLHRADSPAIARLSCLKKHCTAMLRSAMCSIIGIHRGGLPMHTALVVVYVSTGVHIIVYFHNNNRV